MDSDAEDTKSHVENAERPKELEPLTKKAKKKKKKKEPPPVQAKVQILRDHPERIPPIVGYFPSGFDLQKNSESGSGSTSIRVYRSKKQTKRLQLVVSPNGSPVDFVGTNYTGEATAGQRCMYALGVFDKETQTLKVVPIAANKIFRLDPKVRGLEYSDKEPANSTVGELTAQQKAERAREATIMWGTKKAIKEAKKKEAVKQEEDPESQKDLDMKMKNVAVNKQALESTNAHVSRNIPPYDVSATSSEEAYPLEKIIPKVEWDYLEDIYNLLQHEGADFKDYPTFVCNRIERLKKIQDESEKKKLSCIFSYINHLIKFKEQHSMDGAFSAKNHKIPSILRHKFSTMFAATEKRRLPPEKINLLISYVLVLTLFTDQFRTDFTDISRDLKMSVLPVRQRYEHLGCKILRQSSLWYATLPVPLQFPELRLRKRKR